MGARRPPRGTLTILTIVIDTDNPTVYQHLHQTRSVPLSATWLTDGSRGMTPAVSVDAADTAAGLMLDVEADDESCWTGVAKPPGSTNLVLAGHAERPRRGYWWVQDLEGQKH